MSAWTNYAQQLVPALAPAAAGSGAAAWLLLAMAAHESGVPPVSYSSLVLETNPWGIGCNGQPGSCVVYASLEAAGQALPGLLPRNALAAASDPQRFMATLEADDWSGDVAGTYATDVLAIGAAARAALEAIGADPVTGEQAGADQVQTVRFPWTGVGLGALLLAAGLGIALSRRKPTARA